MLFFFFAIFTCASLFSCTPPDRENDLLSTSLSVVSTGTGSRIQVHAHDSLKSITNDVSTHAPHTQQPITHEATCHACTKCYFPWPGAAPIKAVTFVYRQLNESTEIYP